MFVSAPVYYHASHKLSSELHALWKNRPSHIQGREPRAVVDDELSDTSLYFATM
jgi:hypothetical protein